MVGPLSVDGQPAAIQSSIPVAGSPMVRRQRLASITTGTYSPNIIGHSHWEIRGICRCSR